MDILYHKKLKTKTSIIAFVIALSALFLYGLANASLGYGARVYNSANITISSGSWQSLAFNTATWDYYGWHSTGNSTRLTVPEDYVGFHVISCHIVWASNTTGHRGIGITMDGSGIAYDMRLTSSTQYQSVSTIYRGLAGNFYECWAFQNSGVNLDIVSSSKSSPEFAIAWLGELAPTPDPLILNHHERHEAGGEDEIDVTGLYGVLEEPQNAGWFHGLPITTTGTEISNVLHWDGTYWSPTIITGTGELPDMITSTISGTVTVVISDMLHFTNTLQSGNQMGVWRTFSYGEAAIAIGLFILAATIGLLGVFWFVKRE